MAKLSEVMGAIAPGTEEISVSDYRPIPGQTNGLGDGRASYLDYRDLSGLDGEGEVDELDSLGWLGASEEDVTLTIDGLDEGDLGWLEASTFGKSSVRMLEGRRAAMLSQRSSLNQRASNQRVRPAVRAAFKRQAMALTRQIIAVNAQIDAARRAAVAKTKARSQVVAAMGQQNSGGLFNTAMVAAKGLMNKASAIDRATDAVVMAKAQQDLVPAAVAAPAFRQDVSIDSAANSVRQSAPVDSVAYEQQNVENAEVTDNGVSESDDLGSLGQAASFQRRALARRRSRAPRSVMDRIIATNSALLKRVVMNVKAKAKLAARSPVVAIKLAQQQAKTQQPGTSRARAILGAFSSASKYAKLAKKYKNMAALALRRNDKRLAAAYTVKALEYARKAGIDATKAEKTRLAVGLDRYNKVFTAQAAAIRGAAQKLQQSGTNSGKVAQMLAQAETLEANARKIRAQAATIEAQPDAPKGLPTQQRIAEIANKFNVRTSFKNKSQNRRALISVLGEAYDAPLAQADDFEGALGYYGADGLGTLAAHIEFGNYTEAEALLQGLGDDFGGFFDSVANFYDKAKDTLNNAKNVAQKAYDNVIKPVAQKLGIGAKAAAAAKPPAVAAPAPVTAAAASALVAAADSASSSSSGGGGGGGGDTIFGMNKMVVYGGGAALALGAAYLLTRKK